jgi:hypothetical protein
MGRFGNWIGAATRMSSWAVAAFLLAYDCDSKAQTGQQPAAAPTSFSAVTYLAQGWTAADREIFYTTSQGSHLIPFAWFKALRRLDVDQPFAGDQLERYGYLRNDSSSNTNGLPIGFVVEASSGQLGMTCAACHTGQLEYTKNSVTTVLRIDGAPASAADFQQFLLDLTAAAKQTLGQSDMFDAFAKAVLGNAYSATSSAQLKIEFGAWVGQFSDFMNRSLPSLPWGPGRLDAFGMIFNRVAGHDLGIVKNFNVADAPVSYPFLWNASRQDRTQWNGGVPNGLYIQALARNTGEVLGVFADFSPTILIPGIGPIPTAINYDDNSVDFSGLETLEEMIAKLQPPPWPSDLFGLDLKLAAKGQTLFEQNCAQCHAEKTSAANPDTWVTPIDAVGTDPRMFNNALGKSNPGIYIGVPLPPPGFGTFADPAPTSSVLGGSVVGVILDNLLKSALKPDQIANSGVWRATQEDLSKLTPGHQLAEVMNSPGGSALQIENIIKAQLNNLYTPPEAAGTGAAYEARVLHGIWATAPYLHNGSVPNLWELLKPTKDRVPTFMVGSRQFDPKNVGFVTDQTPYKDGTFIVDPKNANGNGNGGHEYGTTLSDDDRWAIVEYLKTL